MTRRMHERLGRLEKATAPAEDLNGVVLFVDPGETEEEASERQGIDLKHPRLLVVEFVNAADGGGVNG